MERNQRRPPDVNEALSSMLWTPYERTPSESSSDDDERLNAKLKKSKSTFDYSFPTKPQHNTTQYVPSFRKIDNFRFSYPYYGPVPIVQKCITELPSYESLYQNNVTPELSRIVGLSSGGGGGRLVHSFTDNFILQNRPSSAGIVVYDPPPGSALLGITSSTSGFSNNFTDDDDVEDDDDEDDEDFDESPNNNNNGPIPAQSFPMIPFEQSTGPQQYEYSPKAAGGSLPRLHRILVAEETKKWHQWPTDSQSGGMDAAQSDNNGDLLLTKNNNISQQQPQQLQQHARKYQFELQQEQQQLRQQQRSQDQLRLGIAAQTMATAAAGRDRDVAVVCEIQDLPGEINRSVTLKHSTLTTIAPEEILSVSETSCTNNGEKPDTKCVRSVQTDLVFSSSRLVEANVRCETASSVRQFFGLNASVDTTSNRRKANASATTTTTSESSQLNPISVIDVDDNANERSHHDPRRSLILDVRDSLLAMRLNIPAAQPSIVDPLKGTSIVSNNNNGNGGSAITTTSVFLPLNESLVATRIGRGRNVNSSANTVISEVHSSGAGAVTTTGNALVQSKPSLTIQVNQGDEIRSSRDSATSISAISGEGFTNQCAGISVVNCYSGSSVPSSCSVNNSATNVVTTSTSSASADDTLSSGINSVNITSVSSSSDCDISNNSAVQNNGLQSSSATSRQHQQDPVDRQPNQSIHRPLARTFTSTECQTDDLPLVDRNEISAAIAQSQTEALISREQRRRERRERRMQGRTRHPHILPPMHHQPPPPPPPAMVRPMLPDILHSHFPPPYTALQSLANPPPPPPPSSMIAPVISTVPMATATAVTDGRFTIPLPVIRRSPSERSGKGCCGQWFAGPPLRALIAVVALGGVACALGGAALGATGLAGPPTSHLTAALLMIGVGVILVTVSGAAWRMTAPGGPPCLGLGSTVDLARCGRRPCNSRGAPHGLLYPEFQHRPPPPSYQASMQEYRLRLLLLDRDRQNGVVRGGSPPPTYRSHAGSLLRAPLSTTGRNGGNGSEYSLPPSYRSRSVNTNTNTSSISRPSVAGHGENSMESLNSTCAPNRSNQNTLSSRSDNGTVLQNNKTTTTAATTTTLMDNFPGTISLIPESTASSIAVTYPSSASTTVLSSSSTTTAIATTTTIPTTKESVHTIAIEAAGATRHSQQQQQQLQQFSFNPSQNLNDKLNPRVTNSNNNNNVNCNNSSKTSNSMNSSSSTSINCTKSHGSPARMMSSPFMSTMSSNLTNVSATTPKEEQTPAAGSSRKELVTIVTISSSSQEPETSASEMEILAHL